MVSASSHLELPLLPQLSQLWATLTKQEERIVGLTQDNDDGEIDELAGDEGKGGHPSTSPCMHAYHTPPSFSDPGRDGHGPSAKDTIRFCARKYACLEPGVAGWSVYKLNS
jgi:hypothetical protein